jgi:hypothetical protein
MDDDNRRIDIDDLPKAAEELSDDEEKEVTGGTPHTGGVNVALGGWLSEICRRWLTQHDKGTIVRCFHVRRMSASVNSKRDAAIRLRFTGQFKSNH